MTDPSTEFAVGGNAIDRLTGQVAADPRALSAPDGAASVTAPGFWCRAEGAAVRAHDGRDEGRWRVCIGDAYARGDRGTSPVDGALGLLSKFDAGHEAALADLGGEYVVACHDARARRLLIATDHFGTRPLYYVVDGERLSFGTDLAWVASQVPGGPRLSHQALYDYLFYSVVPTDRCIYEGVQKLPPCSVLVWQDGRCRTHRYWNPDFSRAGANLAGLRERTAATISDAVARLARLPDVGCFLSGGLDSSTVSGMARRHAGAGTAAFTIGFDVPQFDEREFARISARHFGMTLHEKAIRSAEVSRCAGRVIAAFAEPFGNPSAIPAFVCAEFARDTGVRQLLAGDGGDELFAGNERYQKQLLFEIYGGLPGWLRGGLVDPLAALAARAPDPLRKLSSYVRQARTPLPDRLYSYNLLVRNAPASVLAGDFLATIDVESPYRYARALFAAPDSGDVVDRMMYLDWTITLTDNDLPKVRVTSELAGVRVHFPMLDPDVVRVSTEVPSKAKLTLSELRKFYKESFSDFLPPEVIGKAKHGFGVPVGIWVNRDADLRERVRTRLDSLARRGIVRRVVIDDLLDLQAKDHASYYGSLIWPLFALEEWLGSRGL